ncbi:hypothetical protein GALL_239970 [mine drainage metagenome]|uniref:DUF2970 domain-containing protein n=1 Tax=mine drainage metagenome TaxID=410659 RepID=A0A1J5RPU6_9ZZZZ
MNDHLRSLARSFKAIGWAILGVRKSADREKDFESLPITHVLIAGIVGFVGFIVLLIFIVHSVLAKS